MIAREDHPKPQRLYLKARLNTMSVEEVTHEDNQQSDEQFNQYSQSDDCYERIGYYHYQRFDNGELDSQFRTPICVANCIDLHKAMMQIEEQILNKEITITIHKKVEYFDDIPSPSIEELDWQSQFAIQFQCPIQLSQKHSKRISLTGINAATVKNQRLNPQKVNSK